MNKIDRCILGLMALLAAGLCLFVMKIQYDLKHPRSPRPVVLAMLSEKVIGPHPEYEGSANAPFTLVEFGDYQCPTCIALHSKVLDALQTYSGHMNMVFHQFPLPMHHDALPAALTAEAARAQGRFWPVHNALMANRGYLHSENLQQLIQRLHLDRQRFDRDYRGTATGAVERDIQLGKSIGVPGTPTFFLCCPDRHVIRLGSLAQVKDFIPLKGKTASH